MAAENSLTRVWVLRVTMADLPMHLAADNIALQNLGAIKYD